MEILPLVEDVVRLRKAGGTYKGLCPFHSERTPSFTVSPARGTFKCFGCGEGGDAITFVEKTENVDFVDAIELLARRFGVELEYEEASPEQEQKRRRAERLRALLERAAEFYARVLWDSDAGARGARVPRVAWARRGGLPRVPARLRAGRGEARVARAAGGLHAGGAARRRAREPPRQRLLPAPHRLPARGRARPRARLSGAEAPRRRPAAGEVRQLARGRAVPQGRSPLRARHCAAGDRARGSRASSSRGTPT